MGQQELFTLAVAIAGVMIVGRAVANRLEIPDAIVLVVLGVLAGLIPQVPNIDLPPDVVLVLFLPPLVYNAAFLSAPRESRENAVPITGLAFGATTATIAAVGAVTRLVLPGIGWAPALAFAAAVAPTDAVAATSVLTRLGAPQRVVTILEGESLINDAVALTAFGLAVEAMARPFTFGHGVTRLAEVVLGGIAYGLVVAVVIERVRKRVKDPASQILISLITPFVAYIPADELNVSGVLATVVTGVYLGNRAEGLIQPASRVAGTMFWRTLIFLLESALFVLLGLELRSLATHLPGAHPASMLTGAAAAVVGGGDRGPAGLGAAGGPAGPVPARPAPRVRPQPVAAAAGHRLGRHARGHLAGHRAQRADHAERDPVHRTAHTGLPGRGRGGGHAGRPGPHARAAAARPGPGPGRAAPPGRGPGPGQGHRGRPGPPRSAGRGGRGGRGHGRRVPPAVRDAAGPGPGDARRRERGRRGRHHRPEP